MRDRARSNLPKGPNCDVGFPLSRAANVPAEGAPPEQALLVGVLLPDTRANLRDPLGELASLAESAGVEIVDSMIQKRMKLSAAHAVGKGKLAELAERAEANGATVIIFDNELTPRQIRGIERATSLKIIDRSELILDIFANRARTREAQLQVELAQLEYTAPRLRGMWTHLERIAGAGGSTAAGAVGGVGTRGPGERQIEIDRRIVRKRIGYLKQQIEEIDRRKQREVLSRKDQFTVSLVGYTNAGKSTLLNRLTGSRQFADDMLFATLDTKTVRWNVGEGQSVLLSDTVGFVRDLPHKLVASFRATLEEAIHADLLLHVADVSSPDAYKQVEAVDAVLKELGCDDLPQITLLNKSDIADDAATVEMLARYRETMVISALTGAGIDALVADVAGRLTGRTVEAIAEVSHRDGKLLAEIERVADVLERTYVADGVELRVRMNRVQMEQLCGAYPQLEVTMIEKGDDESQPTDSSAE